jgi:hypothetical protein
VARSGYGPITLARLAIGLFSHGLYCVLEARCRDLTPDDELGHPAIPSMLAAKESTPGMALIGVPREGEGPAHAPTLMVSFARRSLRPGR